MKRNPITPAEYERRAGKLLRDVKMLLAGNVWPVRVKRSCMYGDPAKLAESVGTACVLQNYRHTEPEYEFTHTPPMIDEFRNDDGDLIFRVIRRGGSRPPMNTK
jgi:hypothetical protein